MKKVLIAGIDGYLGWTLATYLGIRGYEVYGFDNFNRRKWVSEMSSVSAIPISAMEERIASYKNVSKSSIQFYKGDACDYVFVSKLIGDIKPDAIVHLAECPSAPFSMKGVNNTVEVFNNNIIGTLNILHAIRDFSPTSHLVKLGTMGEYGTPNIDIPEGFFEVEFRGRKDVLPFPKQAGSWYHWTKVHDSNNIMFACDIWNLRSTDIMQGIVFGSQVDEIMLHEKLKTRLDFDQAFGTVINRFCCQAVIGHPLTTYGKGTQTRSFIPLRDSMQCLKIVIDNPPQQGEYRVINQFESTYSILELSKLVQEVAINNDLPTERIHVENPRKEAEEHYFNPENKTLLKLGYAPSKNLKYEIDLTIKELKKHTKTLKAYENILIPDIRWDGEKRKSGVLDQKSISANMV
ncbi:MAG: NAD-dependent epimerase/dehydratase family protein [Flammeovirgaceae bacterium]